MAPLFVGPFSIGDRAQTSADRRVSQRGELSRSREGCNVGPCLTSSYISPHNRAPRQIPLFVHILCIVTRVSRGTQGARTTSGEYVLSFFSFLSVLLPLFLSFSLLRPPHLSLSVDLAYPPPPPPPPRVLFLALFIPTEHRGGGWDQIVYLPDKNRIESCHENRPLIMRIPRIAIVQHPIPSSFLSSSSFLFFLSRKKLDREEILLLEVCQSAG